MYRYPNMNFINDMYMPNMINDYNERVTNTNTNNNLLGAYDGYIKGNLFNDLYSQYSNYQPTKLIPNNEQAELLLNVNQISFQLHELKLYLDIHPNDNYLIQLYNNCQEQLNNSILAYENKYSPLLSDSKSNSDNFSWEAYSWPWEMEEL